MIERSPRAGGSGEQNKETLEEQYQRLRKQAILEMEENGDDEEISQFVSKMGAAWTEDEIMEDVVGGPPAISHETAFDQISKSLAADLREDYERPLVGKELMLEIRKLAPEHFTPLGITSDTAEKIVDVIIKKFTH